MMRTLVLDHYQNKTEDYERNMKEFLSKLVVSESDNLRTQSNLFDMYRGILTCNIDDIELKGRSIQT